MTFDPVDLASERLYIDEGLGIDDGVDEQEALAVLDVKVAHRRKLLRSRCIKDFQDGRCTVHVNLFSVEVLNGRVVLFDKISRDKLNGESALPHAPRPKDYNFVFSHRHGYAMGRMRLLEIVYNVSGWGSLWVREEGGRKEGRREVTALLCGFLRWEIEARALMAATTRGMQILLAKHRPMCTTATV